MFSNSVDMLIKKKREKKEREPIFRIKNALNKQLFLNISKEGTSFRK